MIKLTLEQEKAANSIYHWYLNTKNPYFYLAGYAGTGKTTIVNEIVQRLKNQTKISEIYCAFTNKAASVLRDKGNTPATTIFKLLYWPQSVKNIIEFRGENIQTTTLGKIIKPSLNCDYLDKTQKYNLVILDECSMINDEDWSYLLSHKVKVLVLGDPGQLPPVEGHSPFQKIKPDVFLEEIHRQAEDSPIIRLATWIRKGKPLDKFLPQQWGKDVWTIPAREWGKFLNAKSLNPLNYQLITATKAANRKATKVLRQRQDFVNPLPYSDEPIVSLANNYSEEVFNGEIYSNCNDLNHYVEGWKKLSPNILLRRVAHMEIKVKNENRQVPFDNCNGVFFLYTSLGKNEIAIATKKTKAKDTAYFDYAYSITGHKSQGSQFQNVAILDNSSALLNASKFSPNFSEIDPRKWRYTAVTRAIEKVFLFV